VFLFIVRSVKTYTKSSQQFRTVHRSLLDTNNITFRVRALSDARLLLLSTPGNVQAPSYEIEIGAEDNTKTLLRVRSVVGDITIEQVTKDILNVAELRPFWISWMNGTIKFGTGSVVGLSQVIFVTDPQPTFRKDVHSIAVSSSSLMRAEWEFGDDYDSGLLMYLMLVITSKIHKSMNTVMSALTFISINSTPNRKCCFY